MVGRIRRQVLLKFPNISVHLQEGVDTLDLDGSACIANHHSMCDKLSLWLIATFSAQCKAQRMELQRQGSPACMRVNKGSSHRSARICAKEAASSASAPRPGAPERRQGCPAGISGLHDSASRPAPPRNRCSARSGSTPESQYHPAWDSHHT